MKKLIAFSIVLLFATMACFAQSETAVMQVYANLLPIVSVESTSLDFGDWFVGDAAKTTTATITVTASGGLIYTIALDAGLYADGTTRNVADATGVYKVSYSINDPSNLVAWGDGVVYGDAVPSVGTGLPQYFAANGTLFSNLAASDSPAGLYTDVVNVTINY